MNESTFDLIKTEDGTYSLYSIEYSQAMHSISGAFNEALHKHVYPSKILENNNDDLFILDIGFGLGYNILALIAEFLKKNTGQKLHIFSLEKDFDILSKLKLISFGDNRDLIYDDIKKAFALELNDFNKYSIRVKFGDARKSTCSFSTNYFDAVFHDPYSPAKNPELWSVEFFSELYRIMMPHAILTTYSSALHIRNAMHEAGFLIGRGPSVGKKKEGTVASKSGNIPLLSEEDILVMKCDIKSTPYRDCDLNETRDNILQKRIYKIKQF